MPTEPIPVNEFITELEDQWTHTNVSGAGKKKYLEKCIIPVSLTKK